jgi:hypothetical protein
MLSTTKHLNILLTKSVGDHAAGFRNDLHAFGYQFREPVTGAARARPRDHGFDLIRPDINCASGAEIAVTVIE